MIATFKHRVVRIESYRIMAIAQKQTNKKQKSCVDSAHPPLFWSSLFAFIRIHAIKALNLHLR